MRIAFSGAANTGKTTLVEAFRRRWSMYSYPKKTYRDIIKENNLNHSSKTSEETQLLILDWMMKEQEKYPKGSKVVYDRCPWDNLAYTLQGNANGIISDAVAAASISLVRESMKQLDIIFWIKRDENIIIKDDGMRDVNREFIEQTEEIFQDLYHQYTENSESDIFYPKDDCPAIIQVEGSTVDDRLAFIGEFIDYKGDLIETTDSILSAENLKLMEQLLTDQEIEIKNEEDLMKLMNELKKTKK